MLGQLSQSRMLGNLGQIKRMYQMVKSAGNPQAMLNQMMGQNPQLKQVMDTVQQSGGDPKKAFYRIAEERGVNPDDILNALK